MLVSFLVEILKGFYQGFRFENFNHKVFRWGICPRSFRQLVDTMGITTSLYLFLCYLCSLAEFAFVAFGVNAPWVGAKQSAGRSQPWRTTVYKCCEWWQSSEWRRSRLKLYSSEVNPDMRHSYATVWCKETWDTVPDRKSVKEEQLCCCSSSADACLRRPFVSQMLQRDQCGTYMYSTWWRTSLCSSFAIKNSDLY